MLDRFGQIEPKALIAVDGYWYNGKPVGIIDKVREIVARLPSLTRVVVVPYLAEAPDVSAVPKAAPARAGGAVEGSYFSNHYAADIATPTATRFIGDYEKKYGMKPDDVAALTYDAVGLVVKALEAAPKPERQALRDAMSNISNYGGVTGEIRFTPGSGDPIKSAVIMQIKGDKFAWVTNAAP